MFCDSLQWADSGRNLSPWLFVVVFIVEAACCSRYSKLMFWEEGKMIIQSFLETLRCFLLLKWLFRLLVSWYCLEPLRIWRCEKLFVGPFYDTWIDPAEAQKKRYCSFSHFFVLFCFSFFHCPILFCPLTCLLSLPYRSAVCSSRGETCLGSRVA